MGHFLQEPFLLYYSIVEFMIKKNWCERGFLVNDNETNTLRRLTNKVELSPITLQKFLPSQTFPFLRLVLKYTNFCLIVVLKWKKNEFSKSKFCLSGKHAVSTRMWQFILVISFKVVTKNIRVNDLTVFLK